MSTNEDQFLQSLRATFKVEANEHLEAIDAGLLALEKSITAEEQQPLVETVFRAAHSLKGAARAVNFVEVESVCQVLEDVFAAWKRRESLPTAQGLDVVQQALDAVSVNISAPQSQSDRSLSSHVQALRTINFTSAIGAEETTRAETAAAELAPVSSSVAIDKTPVVETVRIGVAKLDARLL